MDVLFIDDDHAVNRYHEIILERVSKNYKLTLEFYTNPIEAIDFLSATDQVEYPKLIFLDINMPVMNGWEFIAEYEVRNLHPSTCIILLTTSKNPNYKIQASELNLVKHFKIKPLDESFFEGLVQQYVVLNSPS